MKGVVFHTSTISTATIAVSGRAVQAMGESISPTDRSMLLMIPYWSFSIQPHIRADTSMIAVLIVDVWKTTPFMALLILAGLQMIPRDMYESAKIDGIHPVRVFFRVTLPLLKPALMVAVIFRLLDALRIFDLIYVLTPQSDATVTMSVLSYRELQQFGDYGEGSAMSTLLFAIIAIFVALYIWLGRVDLSGERSK